MVNFERHFEQFLGSISITTYGKIQCFELGVLEPLCELLLAKDAEARLMAITSISIVGEVPKVSYYYYVFFLKKRRKCFLRLVIKIF